MSKKKNEFLLKLHTLIISISLLTISYTNSFGQSSFSCIKMYQIKFSGNNNIIQDNGTPYPSVQWQDNNFDGNANSPGESRIPLCYDSGKGMKVEAIFKVEPPQTIPAGFKVKIKGDCKSASFKSTLPETYITSTGSEVKYPATDVKDIFPSNKVGLLDPLTIVWSISWDDGNTWKEIGQSENKVYITLSTPLSGKLYESLLDIGFRNTSVVGLSDPKIIVDKIYSNFKSPVTGVKRKQKDGYNNTDGTVMTYWKPPSAVTSFNQRLSGLLVSNTGSCIAWSQLFHESIDAMGISDSYIYELRVKTTYNANGFLVKDWKHDKHITTGDNGIRNSVKTSDDFEVIQISKGKPKENCIIPASGMVKIKTKNKLGDDEFVIVGLDTIAINTGADGICQTLASGGDTQLIALNKGLKNSFCLTPGRNGKLESGKSGDDNYVMGLFNGQPFPYVIYTSSTLWGDIVPLKSQGQGNEYSPPAFENHFIVVYNGLFYDPSYGSGPFSSSNTHEVASIYGIYQELPGGLLRAQVTTGGVLDYNRDSSKE